MAQARDLRRPLNVSQSTHNVAAMFRPAALVSSLFVLGSLAGCGDDSAELGGAGGGTAAGAGATQGGASNTGGDGGGSPLAGAPGSAGSDSGGAGGGGEGGAALGPNPPAGASLCGDGTFTAADAANTCALVSSGAPPNDYERHCNAVTMAGGEWQAWCSPAGVYLWARFESVVATGTYELCAGAPGMFSNLGWYNVGVAGQSAGGSLSTDVHDIDVSPAVDVEVDLFHGDPDFGSESGAASIWLVPMLDVACPGGGFGPPFVAAGATLSWEP